MGGAIRYTYITGSNVILFASREKLLGPLHGSNLQKLVLLDLNRFVYCSREKLARKTGSVSETYNSE